MSDDFIINNLNEKISTILSEQDINFLGTVLIVSEISVLLGFGATDEFNVNGDLKEGSETEIFTDDMVKMLVEKNHIGFIDMIKNRLLEREQYEILSKLKFENSREI